MVFLFYRRNFKNIWVADSWIWMQLRFGVWLSIGKCNSKYSVANLQVKTQSLKSVWKEKSSRLEPIFLNNSRGGGLGIPHFGHLNKPEEASKRTKTTNGRLISRDKIFESEWTVIVEMDSFAVLRCLNNVIFHNLEQNK